QHRPTLYQEIDGVRRQVLGGYVHCGRSGVGFRMGAYDRSRPLVIDPVLSYATFLGGSNIEYPNDIAVDAQGSAYVTGYTRSIDFPVKDSFGMTPHPRYGYQLDAFVAKLDPTGTRLVYTAYLGGSNNDEGTAVAVDGAGNAYVTGATTSYYEA